jgi:thioredoxin 1
MAAELFETSDTQFEQDVLKSELPVMVDFWAEWCQPCKMLEPALESLAEEYEGQVRFAKINADENMETSERFRVFGLPTVLLFKNGEVVEHLQGLRKRGELQKAIASALEPQEA